MTGFEFGCMNCRNRFIVPDGKLVSPIGLLTDESMMPQGWQMIRGDKEIRFQCPDCCAQGELARRTIQLKDMRQYILDFPSEISDFNLNGIIANAEDVIDACRFVQMRREREREEEE